MTPALLNSIVAAAAITVTGTIIVALIRVHANWRNLLAEAEEKRATAERERAEARKAEMAAMQELNNASLSMLEPSLKAISQLKEDVSELQEENKRQGVDVFDLQKENKRLQNRVDSLEENDRTTRLAQGILEGEYKKLQSILKDWHAGIMILIAQIERHDSSPEWRPKDK